MATFDELRAMIDHHRIEMVDLKFSDLFGRWQHVTLPVSAFDPRTLEKGVAFDGASVPGFKPPAGADLVLIPDPATAQPDPFWEVPTLNILCHIAEADTGEWFSRDPRRIAVRAVESMRQEGIADDSLWLTELEFYVFNKVSYGSDINTSFYQIDSDEADWNTAKGGEAQLGHNIPHRGGYHASLPLDRLHNLRSKMVKMIEQAGMPVRYHHHEVGGPGQCEIELTRQSLMKAADGTMWAKYIIKNLAIRSHHSPTFMPKPLYDEAGSGMHFHQNLLKDGRNLFYDERGEHGLSQLAHYYMGGLLQHGRALLALTNPSTNSYKRLVPGFEAPTLLFYGLANRSAAIRIPKYANTEAEKRIEFRPPDGTCNVYLAMAAQLLAGLDGIRKCIDPRKLGWGPINEDVRALRSEQLARILSVPTSLREALGALEEDHAFLTDSGVFPEDFVATWVDRKIALEADEVRNRPHPYEMTLYYDF
jgi:glutamine synthetase